MEALVLVAIMIGVFLWFKSKFKAWVSGFGKPKPKRKSAAEEYLEDSIRYNRENLARYRANQARKEELINEAKRYEEFARYGSDYSRRENLKKADQLRREAAKL